MRKLPPKKVSDPHGSVPRHGPTPSHHKCDPLRAGAWGQLQALLQPGRKGPRQSCVWKARWRGPTHSSPRLEVPEAAPASCRLVFPAQLSSSWRNTVPWAVFGPRDTAKHSSERLLCARTCPPGWDYAAHCGGQSCPEPQEGKPTRGRRQQVRQGSRTRAGAASHCGLAAETLPSRAGRPRTPWGQCPPRTPATPTPSGDRPGSAG